MKLDPDDPLLTAYAMGELDENACAAVKEALKHSPECRRAVDEIRQAAQMLVHELALEPTESLTTQQREDIENAIGDTVEPAEEPVAAKVVPFRREWAWWISAAAACFALLLALSQFDVREKTSEDLKHLRQEAPDETPTATRPAVTTAQPSADETATTPLPQPEQNTTVSNTTPSEDSPALPPASGMQQSGQAPGMDPQLMQRYGLVSRMPASPTAGATPPSSTQLPTMQPETATVYGASPMTQAPSTVPTSRYGMRGPDSRAPGGSMNPELMRRYGLIPAAPDGLPRYRRESGPVSTASYPSYGENSFATVLQAPLSTFSIDVDTASYANVRRFINQGQLPPHDAVRIEEMINYFTYDYAGPASDHPFAAHIEIAECPWRSEHRLVRIGLQGRRITPEKRPPANLVFLIDISGSMQPAERLPLVKQALRMLAKKMTAEDRIAIVVYAASSGVVLPSTSGRDKDEILAAIDSLEPGGSTNGGAGIQAAYAAAEGYFNREGINRVILCTDGDFNVGITSRDALVELIQEKAKTGVFLSALGVGTDNYKDSLLQKLADCGNGNYHYLDTIEEAQKVLIEQMNATLMTIAKDVKIQVEFNPAVASAYRLIGYEKRALATQDFNDDRKDAGEIGAGHSVTALYEVIPAGLEYRPAIEDLKYQPQRPRPVRNTDTSSAEMLTVKIRYKEPSGTTSRLVEFAASDTGTTYSRASSDFRFAAAVAEFGMILRASPHSGRATLDTAIEHAAASIGADPSGYRAEFLNLVRRAKTLR